MGKGGPCSLQIPLLIAGLISELWWGAQRKLQSLLSRKENDHMEGWLEQGAGDKGNFGTQGFAMGLVTGQGGSKAPFKSSSFSQGAFNASFNLYF